MTKKSKGFRSGTRKKLRQKPYYRPPITKFVQRFQPGQKVVIKPEPSSHKGMPFPRFKGCVGKVTGKRGNSYVLEVKVGGETKKVISRPEHLKTLG